MKRVMRQVFGSSRPKDIWLDMLTFDRLNTRALIHIVYWAGLGLLIIAAFGVLGVAVGNALSDGSPMAYLLSLPMLVVGWLAILIGMIVWRVLCGFILSVMGIGEDLRALRQMQEPLGVGKAEAAPEAVQASPFVAEADPPTAAPARIARKKDVPQRPAEPMDTLPEAAPFAPEAPETDAPGADNILEDPFFRPRFEKPEA